MESTTATLCEVCKRKHLATMPHDVTSVFYQQYFEREQGRPPTDDDASAHCSDEVRTFFSMYYGLVSYE